MKQLAGGDDLWFAIDTETTPMHLLAAAIYDPATSDAGPVDLDAVKAFLEERLGGLPLRQKLVTVPLRADFPYWVEDEDFDIDRHLRHVELDPPGDESMLRATLRDIAEIPLDRSRPLWEMVLITGLRGFEDLPEGCFALAQKFHHGQFDGTNLVKLGALIHTLSPKAEPPRPDRWKPERTPSGVELLMRAPWNRARRMLSGARVLRENVPRVVEALSPKTAANSREQDASSIPPTRFAEPIATRERVFDGISVPLEEAKAIRKTVEGATVNDVALAVCAGALRRYLESHDELPADPIVVTCPVSAHEKGEDDSVGNRVVTMRVALPTEVADPRERLHRVRDSTRRSKATTQEMGAGNVADLMDMIPTYLLGPLVDQLVGLGLTRYLPQPSSGIGITNVPGPPVPGYFLGARMTKMIASTFLFDGMGIILAISSYCDDFLVQFTSTPSKIPDPDFFRQCLQDSFEELRKS